MSRALTAIACSIPILLACGGIHGVDLQRRDDGRRVLGDDLHRRKRRRHHRVVHRRRQHHRLHRGYRDRHHRGRYGRRRGRHRSSVHAEREPQSVPCHRARLLPGRDVPVSAGTPAVSRNGRLRAEPPVHAWLPVLRSTGEHLPAPLHGNFRLPEPNHQLPDPQRRRLADRMLPELLRLGNDRFLSTLQQRRERRRSLSAGRHGCRGRGRGLRSGRNPAPVEHLLGDSRRRWRAPDSATCKPAASRSSAPPGRRSPSARPSAPPPAARFPVQPVPPARPASPARSVGSACKTAGRPPRPPVLPTCSAGCTRARPAPPPNAFPKWMDQGSGAALAAPSIGPESFWLAARIAAAMKGATEPREAAGLAAVPKRHAGAAFARRLPGVGRLHRERPLGGSHDEARPGTCSTIS